LIRAEFIDGDLGNDVRAPHDRVEAIGGLVVAAIGVALLLVAGVTTPAYTVLPALLLLGR
jgi:hypothetical protein